MYHLKRSTKLARNDEHQTEHQLAGGLGTGRICVTLKHIFNIVNQSNGLEDTKEAKYRHMQNASRNTDTLLTRCKQRRRAHDYEADEGHEDTKVLITATKNRNYILVMKKEGGRAGGEHGFFCCLRMSMLKKNVKRTMLPRSI